MESAVKKESLPPIFIVGSPRSGTTLMRFCLSKHPNIYICPESGFFMKVYGNRRLIKEKDIQGSADKLIKKLFVSGDLMMKDFECLKGRLVSLVSRDAKTYKDVAEIVFGEFAAHMGKKRWGEKTPNHIYYIKEILELFPSAKIICTSRNHKNVVASYIKSGHLPDDYIDGVMHYRLSDEYANKYKDKILPISYEDITDDPEPVLRKVCEYINEDFVPEMLTPGMIDSSYKPEMMKLDESIVIEKDNSERWKNVLSPCQSEFIDYIEGNTSFRLRYLPDILRMIYRKYRFLLSTYKNRLGYENIKRYRKGIWS